MTTEWREPRIISLVLGIIIPISLLSVQESREVKYDDMLLAESVDGISSESGIVYKFVEFAGSSDVINEY